MEVETCLGDLGHELVPLTLKKGLGTRVLLR